MLCLKVRGWGHKANPAQAQSRRTESSPTFWSDLGGCLRKGLRGERPYVLVWSFLYPIPCTYPFWEQFYVLVLSGGVSLIPVATARASLSLALSDPHAHSLIKISDERHWLELFMNHHNWFIVKIDFWVSNVSLFKIRNLPSHRQYVICSGDWLLRLWWRHGFSKFQASHPVTCLVHLFLHSAGTLLFQCG